MIISVIRGATPIVKGLVSVLGFLKPVLDPLISVFAGVVGAVLLFKDDAGVTSGKGIGSLIGTFTCILNQHTSLIAIRGHYRTSWGFYSSSGGVFLVVGSTISLVNKWLTGKRGRKKARA